MPATLTDDLSMLQPPGSLDDFVTFERPVWKEHFTREGRDADGEIETPSVFMGREELQKVCDNCNDRIRDTGDFATLCLRHTRDDKSLDNEVVGFAGPFRLLKMGGLKQKWHILATFWVYKEDAHKLKKYPRVSVEYWSDADDPTNGYFDPISLLGAETPELDLGIRYSQDEHSGRRLLRYSKVERFEAAASPGGSNTFVPGCISADGEDPDSDAEKKKHRYEQEGQSMGGMLSAEALSQMVEAFTPVIRAVVQEEMIAAQPKEPVVDPNAVPEEPAAPLPGEEMGMEGEPPMGEDGLPPEMGDAVPGMEGDDDEGLDLDEDDDGDIDDTDIDATDLDAKLNDPDKKPEKYSADHPPDAASESLSEPQSAVEGAMEGAAELQKKVQKYEREHGELRRRYEKEVAEHRKTAEERDTFKGKVQEAERKEMRATRYSKLKTLAGDGYAFDPEEEIADCESMTPEQFDKHCDRIVAKYQRAPIGRTLPQDKPTKIKPEPTKEKVDQYAKQAMKKVADARKKGETLDYDAVLRELREADQTVAV